MHFSVSAGLALAAAAIALGQGPGCAVRVAPHALLAPAAPTSATLRRQAWIDQVEVADTGIAKSEELALFLTVTVTNYVHQSGYFQDALLTPQFRKKLVEPVPAVRLAQFTLTDEMVKAAGLVPGLDYFFGSRWNYPGIGTFNRSRVSAGPSTHMHSLVGVAVTGARPSLVDLERWSEADDTLTLKLFTSYEGSVITRVYKYRKLSVTEGSVNLPLVEPLIVVSDMALRLPQATQRVRSEDLILKLRIERFRETRSIHPALIPGMLLTLGIYAVFGPTAILEAEMAGTLTVENGNGVPQGQASGRTSMRSSVNFKTFDGFFPQQRARFLEELLGELRKDLARKLAGAGR